MDLLDTARVALASLRPNPLRTSLPILGMAIGVGAVITLMSIGQGAQAITDPTNVPDASLVSPETTTPVTARCL